MSKQRVKEGYINIEKNGSTISYLWPDQTMGGKRQFTKVSLFLSNKHVWSELLRSKMGEKSTVQHGQGSHEVDLTTKLTGSG